MDLDWWVRTRLWDDGSPVDPLFYEIPGYETPFLVPRAFTQSVADTFDKYDLRGKLTKIPMPSCLRRLDESQRHVPAEYLQDFLQVVRERIQPRFDITPEFLAHLRAYDLNKGQYQHIFEDVWITGAPPGDSELRVEYNHAQENSHENRDSHLQCGFLGVPLHGYVDRWASKGH